MNVLVVCHGNLCRSPLAGAVLVRLLGQEYVRDRGVSKKEGSIAAKKVRLFAEPLGYDLSQHRSRRVTEDDVQWAGIITYMDAGNLIRLAEWPEAQAKSVCLGKYVGAATIPDPGYMPYGEKLQRTLQLCHDAAVALVKSLQTKTPPRD